MELIGVLIDQNWWRMDKLSTDENGHTKVTLSEDDRQAIADLVFKKFEENFFLNVGRGVWKIVWRGIVIGVIVLAAYGAGGGNMFKFLWGHVPK